LPFAFGERKKICLSRSARLRCFATPNFQIREQKLILDFKNPWKMILKYNAEPVGVRLTLSKIPAKIPKVIIGGVFWTKFEPILNKIPTPTFDCRPALPTPSPAHAGQKMRRG